MTIKVFISYSHEDELLLNQLKNHLRPLERRGLIDIWYDREIKPGTAWEPEIVEHLKKAEIILLLISANFIASDYCYDQEVYLALELHEQEKAVVIPILLKPVLWEDTPLARLSCLPRNELPVTTWPDQDKAFLDIVKDIREIAKSLWHTQQKRVTHHNFYRERLELLGKIRKIWIETVLEHSLNNIVRIELNLHEQSESLANPWRLMYQEIKAPSHLLPPGTSITQVYDKARGHLLILGKPGGGKTTLLLELARSLLDRAELNSSHPIPVVFNLSSWAVKRQALSAWLVEEFDERYDVSPEIGQSWVSSNEIVLLLDGLDEVTMNYREMCVNAINAYHKEHKSVSIVVCSRETEYMGEQPARLDLTRAITIQPLTPEQVNEYLSGENNQLAALRLALQVDEGLQELATTPLMLNILSLAYGNSSINALIKPQSFNERQKQVFQTYVERMLARGNARVEYTSEKTIGWLAWLAKQMQVHNQTVFSLKSLQLDWLPNVWIGGTYSGVVITTSTAVGILVGFLTLGFIPILTSPFFYFLIMGGILLSGGSAGLLTWRSIYKRSLQEKAVEESARNLSVHQWVYYFLLYTFHLSPGPLPSSYSQFLDYAAKRILLRKIGNGYIFAHRLLLEYFASLYTSSSQNNTPNSSSNE